MTNVRIRNTLLSGRVGFALLALEVLAGVLSGVGLPTWLVLIAAAIPWVLWISRRVGGAIAFAAVVVLEFWLVLVVMMLTRALGLPILGTVVVVWAALGIAGSLLCVRDGTALPGRRSLAIAFPALLGGLVWLGAMAASSVVPGASRLSWVMLGDSANNLLFARSVIYNGGIVVGPAENPVPLSSSLIAIVMAAGRGNVEGLDLTRHDLGAFAQTWGLLIALTCVTVGVVVGLIVSASTNRALPIAIASAGGSLIPLSWFYTGYPLEYGFFNTHVALPIVFASFVVYLKHERHPAISLALLGVASTLVLAVWSPLVLLPASLGVVVVVRGFRQLIASRGVPLLILIAGLGQLLIYGVAIVLPSLLYNASSLSAPGGAFGFRKYLIVVVALAALVFSILAFRKLTNAVVLGAIALVAASAFGLGLLLFVSRNEPSPWTYYPLKFSWLAAMVMLIVAVGAMFAAVVRLASRAWVRAAGFAAVGAATAAFLVWAPASVGTGYSWMNPIQRMVSGQFLGPGDLVADRILELSDPDQSHFLWKTGDEFEGSINFWVMQLWSDSMNENLDLKYAAYGIYDHESVDELCRIIGLMGGGTIVHTSSDSVESDIRDTCPGSGARVEHWAPVE
ncbi:MAG: hypothetical protein JWP85_2455 [Rhodoglobus sp.]|nr:hypothetical protein [Rhodoglobus sp.]